jgi:hypothetical protein
LRAVDQSRWQLSARREMNGAIAQRSRDKPALDTMRNATLRARTSNG